MYVKFNSPFKYMLIAVLMVLAILLVFCLFLLELPWMGKCLFASVLLVFAMASYNQYAHIVVAASVEDKKIIFYKTLGVSEYRRDDIRVIGADEPKTFSVNKIRLKEDSREEVLFFPLDPWHGEQKEFLIELLRSIKTNKQFRH